MVWWFTEWSIDESFWQINHDSPSPQLWIFTVIYPPAVKCGWEIPEVMEGLLGKSMKIIKTWREKSIAMFDCPRVIASSFWQIFSWEWRSKMISLWSQITDYIIVRLNMWMKYDEVQAPTYVISIPIDTWCSRWIWLPCLILLSESQAIHISPRSLTPTSG